MVDLHLHTNESDGTDSEIELIQKLRNAGIMTYSITDHDTFDMYGSPEYFVPKDMSFIRGIEFSCKTEIRNCHILGYGYNKDVRAFGRMVEKAHKRVRAIVQTHWNYITKDCGIELDEDELHTLMWSYRKNDWKKKLAKLLVDAGHAETEDEAVERFIKPCHTNDIRPDASEAIQAILAAGGIPVWAHPYGGLGKREMHGEEFERQLQILLEAGLQGIECYYSAYDEEQVKSLLEVARKHNLWVSGGSDYHGDNKDVALGTLNNFGKLIREEDLTILKELERRKKEHPYPLIAIEEWHNYGGCFWFMPIKVKDLAGDSLDLDNQVAFKEEEISISERSFENFLYPLFARYFDNTLPENIARKDADIIRKYDADLDFGWYLTDNFYTFERIEAVLKDIEETAEILEKNYDAPQLDDMRNGLRNLPAYMPEYWHSYKNLTEEETDRIARENKEHILDFYQRFVKKLRDMMAAGKAAGYKLISVCGP